MQVAPWDPNVTGPYTVKMRADLQDTNYTDLWWASPAGSESGWGINLNHQGNIIFATLFDYDTDGSPMWLVMSDGERQSDGSYSGTLFRTTGPAFNAQPFNPLRGRGDARRADAPRLLRAEQRHAHLLGERHHGHEVDHAPGVRDRAHLRLVGVRSQHRDELPGPVVEPELESGWGVNITHQGNILFATLFTYDASGKGMWLVMSDGAKTGDASYSGGLYVTHGPAFNAVPFTPTAVTNTQVGTMTFNFTNGNAGTMTYTVNGVSVTKSIQRQVEKDITTECES